MAITNGMFEEYLDFRHYYDELEVLFESITGAKFEGERVTFIVSTEEDVARNMMNMDRNIADMTKVVFEAHQDYIDNFIKHRT